MPTAPPGYRDDLALCLGLHGAADDEVASAALRLVAAMLAFLRVPRPDVDGQPDLPRYLADGTLERYLAVE